MVGEQIRATGGAATLAETLRRGHSVQMHCMRHDRHEQLDLDSLRADAQALEDTLTACGVSDPALWRPPYGSLHPAHSCRVADERGRQLVRWTYDTVDYRGPTAAKMLGFARSGGGPDPSVLGGAALHANSIVLMHDSRRYSSTPEGGAQGTVELIAPLVEYARERGWELGVLGERIDPAAHGPGGAAAFLLPCCPSRVGCRSDSPT